MQHCVTTLVTAAKDTMGSYEQFMHVRRYLDTMFTLLYPAVFSSQKGYEAQKVARVKGLKKETKGVRIKFGMDISQKRKLNFRVCTRVKLKLCTFLYLIFGKIIFLVNNIA